MIFASQIPMSSRTEFCFLLGKSHIYVVIQIYNLPPYLAVNVSRECGGCRQICFHGPDRLFMTGAFIVEQVHGEVTERYGVPMASFRHAVWPDDGDSTTAEAIWGSEVHPDWRVQQLLADVVVYYLEKSYARFCDMYGTVDKSSAREVSYRVKL